MAEMKLLPCPYCGGEATYHASGSGEVGCENAGCAGNGAPLRDAKALAAWNRRAAPAPSSADLGVMEKIIERYALPLGGRIEAPKRVIRQHLRELIDEAFAAALSSLPQAAERGEADKARLDWIAANPQVSLVAGGGYLDADPTHWTVMWESGNRHLDADPRNVVFDQIGKGETVREAIDAAMRSAPR